MPRAASRDPGRGPKPHDGAKPHDYEDHRREATNLAQLRATLTQYMLRRGLRSTGQRRLILETFFESPNHVSIEELLAKVRERDGRVGYATVYRTLKLLNECGIAYERRFEDGLTRYELAGEHSHHDHLICIECGTITEFEDDRIEALQEKIATRHGFELRSHKHELYGVCPQCQAKRKPS